MKTRVLTFLIASFLLMSLFGCKDPEPSVDTAEYQKTELEVYSQLIDELLDSVGFEKSEEGRLVFYLGDTLAAIEKRSGDGSLTTSALSTRSISIVELTGKSEHKFVRATDTLRLEPGDRFTSRWLKLSRVRFNKDFTSAQLSVSVYCGNLCSWTDTFFVTKQDGRWKISEVTKGPPA